MTQPGLAFVHDRLRPEEELLLAALAQRDVSVQRVYAPQLAVSVDALPAADVVINRCLSQSRSLAITLLYEAAGSLVVNSSEVLRTCGDKLATNAALARAGVPAPRTGVAFTASGALELCEQFGWPVVMKPITGSWGRMVSRLSDPDAVMAVIEHRETLGGPQHKIHYIQEYVAKPGRDIRSFVVGDSVICAIYRTSEDWITNTARGAVASNCPVTPQLEAISLAAARAVGGGMVAVDVVESPSGLQVIEVNHTMEFRNSITTTGVDIPDRMAGYVCDRLGIPASTA